MEEESVKKKDITIPALESVIDDLPIVFRKFNATKTDDSVPMNQRLFTQYADKYNSKMYCLLPYRPISKMINNDE